MHNLDNHELTPIELNVFGATKSTIEYLTSNDYHVVIKREWLEIWKDYIMYGVVGNMNAEQLNEWAEDKKND